MSKYKQNGNKTERISVRCTKQEKIKLNKRAETMGMELTKYIRKILFPKKADQERTGEVIELIIEIQDMITHISDVYNDDTIQEEMDNIWKKTKKLLLRS